MTGATLTLQTQQFLFFSPIKRNILKATLHYTEVKKTVMIKRRLFYRLLQSESVIIISQSLDLNCKLDVLRCCLNFEKLQHLI